MIIGYRTKLPDGNPTGFVEKILAGTKIHTIRTNGDRWRIGMSIQHATGVRTRHYRKFADGVLKGKQPVAMWRRRGRLAVAIDGKALTAERLQLLAVNDGFDTLEQFERWFLAVVDKQPDRTYHGTLLHFTDFNY
ncbi:hypothetical protein GCM10023189_43000 [Nibrella saemangeumensis]|uniref:ASCH domain-containing protein n=1 Tax=Nibrella saemangeumensis TaxID=1084526 RepID=A0ABP8NE89_9BACT